MLDKIDATIQNETNLIPDQLMYYILQLKTQISKLRTDILNEPNYSKKLEFIRYQYTLIGVLSDIINGNTRLVGCQHEISYVDYEYQ